MNYKKECIRFGLALILLLMALSVDAATTTTGADEWLVKAREAAIEDDHPNAIRYYREAIEVEPSLREQIANELGNQYTWAEMHKHAIAWYRVSLQTNRNDMDAHLGIARAMAWMDDLSDAEDYYTNLLPLADDRRGEILVGLAKVKSWRGDLAGAEKLYKEALDDDAENLDARLGLAETNNWSGRHRRAGSMYRATLNDEPHNTEALKGLAYTQHWTGRTDLALETLRVGGQNADLLKTADEIAQTDRAVNGSSSFVYRDNSSDGDFQMLSTSVAVSYPTETELRLQYGKGRLNLVGFSEIDRDELVATLSQRFSQSFSITASPGYQWNRFDATAIPATKSPIEEFNLFVWDVYATITPIDWVRFDVGNSRQTLNIPQPIFREIDVTHSTVGLDWRLHRRVNTTWQERFTDFSDGNSRWIFSHRTDWTLPVRVTDRWKHSFILSGGLNYWDHAKNLNNGYFNPLSYVDTYGGLRFVADVTSWLNVNVAGRLGGEHENSADWELTGAFEGELGIRVAKSFVIRTGYVASGSRLDASDGFRSTGAFITLDYLLDR